MPAIVGVLTIDMRIPDAHTLKEKRSVMRSLTQRIRNNYNVSVAEVDKLDNPSRAIIAAAAVANDRMRVERVLGSVQLAISREFRVVIIDVATEIF